MFTRLLVPLDGSPLAESALAHAAAVARPDARITLLQVLEPDAGAGPVDPLEWRLRRDAASLYLERVAEGLRAASGATVTTLVAEGAAAERILSVARQSDAEVIVLSSHGAGGPSAWNVGSVGVKVAARAGASLLLVRGYRQGTPWGESGWRPERYARVLVPLDGSLRGEHVIPAANRLATRHGARLELVHVVDVPGVIERSCDDVAEEEAEEDATEPGRRYLEEVRAECGPDASVATHVLCHADLFSTLEDLIDQLHVDLVLLSAHGHSARRRTHGTLPTNFILHGGTPVLILQDLPWDELRPSAAEVASGLTEAPAPRSPAQQ